MVLTGFNNDGCAGAAGIVVNDRTTDCPEAPSLVLFAMINQWYVVAFCRDVNG